MITDSILLKSCYTAADLKQKIEEIEAGRTTLLTFKWDCFIGNFFLIFYYFIFFAVLHDVARGNILDVIGGNR